ncbi:MAG: hypothetical protein ACOYJZ_05420 [Acutalibacter sp.]|jgi:hypothetical protein
MIKVADTLGELQTLYPGGMFDFSSWERYIQGCFGKDSHIFRDDMEGELSSGKYSYEKDYLPVIQGVYGDPRLERVRRFFSQVTEGLNEKVRDQFGNELDVDVVLYLGLCNGAGWATSMSGRDQVLLGVEKILELDWTSLKDMQGLVYHELGHLYHGQHGAIPQVPSEGPKHFLWQLFSEGVAMCFEQILVGDWECFQQDQGGWKAWCQEHFLDILGDFDNDLPGMTRFNQRYFGDWVDYEGHGDVGYYLGSRWVRSLLERWSFDEVIHFSLETICDKYRQYVAAFLGRESCAL